MTKDQIDLSDLETLPDIVEQPVGNVAVLPYSERLGHAIASILVAENTTLTKLSQRPGMPSLFQLRYWMRNEPKFKEIIEMYRESQAQRIHDELMNDLPNVRHIDNKQELEAHKHFFSMSKYLMEKNAPKDYGATPKAESESVGGTIQIIIDTGIRDDEPELSLEDVIDVTEDGDSVNV